MEELVTYSDTQVESAHRLATHETPLATDKQVDSGHLHCSGGQTDRRRDGQTG